MSKVFCSAPWTSLFIDTFGAVKPCCASKYPLGNIKSKPLEQIINGQKHLEVKASLLAGQPHKHCNHCYDLENKSSSSSRQWFNEFVPMSNPRLEDFNLQMVDIRWSNNCNLRCLYCNELSSSAIADFKGIPKKYNFRQWQDEVLSLIKSNILTIKEVYLVGGEPLLMKENIQLLELLSNQHITVITNLSLDNTKNEIYKQLLTKANVNWEISLEQTGKKYEYVRNNSSWLQVLTNIQDLKTKQQHYGFHFLICIYSAIDLYAVLKELQDLGTVVFSLLTGPAMLSVFNQNNQVKSKVIEQIDLVLTDPKLVEWLGKENLNIIRNVKNNLYNQGEDLTKEFLNYDLKQPGPQKFADLWPEVYALMTR